MPFDMDNDLIKLGVGIEILLKVDSQLENVRKVGKILGWIGQEMIIVEVKDDKKAQFFSMSTPLLVGFVNEGVTYGFKSKLLLKMEILSHIVFVIEYPQEAKKVKLRKEERYKVQLPGTFRLVKKGVDIDAFPIIDMVITNISSTGCGMTTKLELKKGDRVLLNFVLPPQNTINDLPGLIVNSHKNPPTGYKLGVKFYPRDEHKESISRFTSIVNEIKSMTGIMDL